MSIRQLELLYLVPRDKFGNPEFKAAVEKQPSEKELFRYKCFVLGMRDKATVEALWKAEQKRRKAKQPQKGNRRGRRS